MQRGVPEQAGAEPTPSVYTNNAIVASDYVMIPLQAEEESTNNIQNYISYLIDLQETLRKKQFIFLKYILRGVIT
ncbi:hypothetical protein CXU15_09860 [Akkermansia muciniphila]|nr:hypothetical protein CXU18_11290 [Akkermansia muciniphila]PNC47605.1 hypothetical protein CXU11_11210 [Akkermansia muciniphila]PNC49155.1 hypothetical protein CXU15_09860 [Akkermansia muciniphila]GKI07688.1 hypothetical protein CE91St26_23960 [Akkermansia muciniphila]